MQHQRRQLPMGAPGLLFCGGPPRLLALAPELMAGEERPECLCRVDILGGGAVCGNYDRPGVAAIVDDIEVHCPARLALPVAVPDHHCGQLLVSRVDCAAVQMGPVRNGCGGWVDHGTPNGNRTAVERRDRVARTDECGDRDWTSRLAGRVESRRDPSDCPDGGEAVGRSAGEQD